MVQLKSFRYIEQDGRQADERTTDNLDQSSNEQTVTLASTPSTELRESSSSSPESAVSAGGILTNSSGNSSDENLNLTSTSTSRELNHSRLRRQEQDDDEDDEAITLSSSEEYQTAKLDMSDDESALNMEDLKQLKLPQARASTGPWNPRASHMTRVEVGSLNNQQAAGGHSKQAPPTHTFMAPRSSTPDVQRAFLSRQMRRQVSSPVLSSISPQLQQRIYHQQQPLGDHSPAFMKRQSLHDDNLSQLSFGVRSPVQLATPNHFEIQWHQLNLMARTSKVPKFISDNKIYKLIKSITSDQREKDDDREKQPKSPQSQRATFYCSPAIQHKNIPPTISEDYELSEKVNEKDSDNKAQQSCASPTGDPSIRQSPSPPALIHLDGEEYRPILVNVSGSVISGQMTAVLGPSGVGKTMLLNTLTGRNMLQGTGRVRLIGSERKRMSVVTVPQADVLPGKLTTLEDLQFTSRLKNPQADFNHKRNIDRIVKCLQMKKFLHTRIEKLSGGEERRLSIGRELLSSPDILILDEPTSGLDANTCKKIITALRDIVVHSDYIMDRPMSIIVTIHQPQQEVLNLFHRVYVMAVGGRAIYEGSPTMILPTLIEHSSLSWNCAVEQLNDNPAIVALEVASGEYGPQIIAELANHHENQFYEETILSAGGVGSFGQFGTPTLGHHRTASSPFMTPRTRRSPYSGASPRVQLLARQQQRVASSPIIGVSAYNSLSANDVCSIGRPTPILAARAFHPRQEFDKVSAITSVSYASTYDEDLPEPVAPKLKVDKRLRRSVVMKSSFWSHTWTLVQRCWLLTTRDMFLMSIRIVGFVLVAMGMVQTFSSALDPDEHQCPQFETEVSDVASFMESTKLRLNSIGSMIRQSNSEHLFLYHLLLSLMMVSSALTGLMFPLQMRMFIREYKNGWYSPASFVLSTTLAELPVDFIGPTISVVLTYTLCNQPDSPYYWREMGFVVIIIIASSICKSQAQIVGATFMDSVQNSVFLACVAVTGPALLSGVAVRITQMSSLLQMVSYGSFLRYAFEGLLLLRYGLGICPCEPELIHGYPARIAAEAIPEQLNNLARGIIELNTAVNDTSNPTPVTLLLNDTNSLASVSSFEYSEVSKEDNMFARYLQLVNGASNLFVPNPSELGDCASYRSLYLMDMNIPNDALPTWVGIMLSMWIFSRFLTYFTVRTVIKFRRKT